MVNLITEHIDIWIAAQTDKANAGRGRRKNANGQSPHGIKKLRELILELAVRGKLVPQDPKEKSASVLLEKIAKEKARLIKEGKIKKQKPLPEISEDEKPFDLPVGWEWTRLGSISQINPRNEAEDNVPTSFIPMPLISTSHTGEHGQEIKSWGEIKKGYTHFADGDIGVAKITPCFENSKAAVLSGLENGIGAGTTELHIARPFGSTLVPRYVLLFLKAPMFLHVGETKMTGTAGQKRVPKKFFSETPLPLPPLAEQHRIVAKVDELMVLCDQLEHQQNDSNATHQTLVETLLTTLTNAADQGEFTETWQRIANHFDTLFTTEQSIDQLKQTILQLAVMGKLVPQDPNDLPASVLLEKIAKEKARLIKEGKIKKQKPLPEIGEDEKPFDLPKGWEWTRLGAAGVGSTGKTPSTRVPKYYDGARPFLGPGQITLEGDIIDSDKTLTEEGCEHSVIAESGDILMVCIGGSIGKSAIARSKVAFNQQINCIRPLFVDSIYLNVAMKTPHFQTSILDTATGSATPIINRSKWEELLVALPPLSEQHRIVAKVDELMALCDTLKARLNDAQTTQIQLADAIVEQAVA